jgi:hypothetical protein
MTVCSRFIILFYRDESLAALHEAIRMAQETNDHECLQHALVSNAVFRSPLAETGSRRYVFGIHLSIRLHVLNFSHFPLLKNHFMPKSPNSQLYLEGFWRSVLSFSRKYWQKHFRLLFQNCCMWSHKTYQNIIGVLKLKKCCYIFEKVLAWNILDFFSRTVTCEDTKLARNVSMIGILKNFVTFLSNFISKIAALAFDWTIQFYLLQNYCMQSHKNC